MKKMVLTNNSGTVLDNYYETTVPPGHHPDPVLPCDNSTNYNPWGIPYDLQEFLYWVLKMLVLPGLVSGLIIFLVILPTFQNPIFGIINTILTPIASVFILIMVRESARATRNRISSDRLVSSGTPLNTIVEDESFRIGFVGDIMMMNGHILEFDPAVIQFFSDVNLIVGNLEGIVTTYECRLSQQRHIPDILRQLETLLSPNINWLLCLSNNHSIDYGNRAFHTSLIDIQTEPRFDVFGRNDVENVLVQGHPISIASGTEWSNQNTWTCTSRYRNTELWTYHNDNALNNVNRFNILFPHWGYENERYVRRRIQLDATALLNGQQQVYTRYQNLIRQRLDKIILPDPSRKWDLIFGQHSHTPQPIMMVDDYLNLPNQTRLVFHKLVAFSGGNFTSGAWIIRRKKHIYGYVMKCDIGPLVGHPNQLAVGKVEWRTTVNVRHRIGDNRYKTVEFYTRRYRTFLHYLWSLLIGVGIVALILFLRYLDSIL